MTTHYTDLVEAILRDAQEAGDERISLVEVMWRFDARQRIPMLPDEINEALASIDGVVEEREKRELFFRFAPDVVGSHVVVSKEDFHWADQEYNRRFWKAYRELRQRDQPNPE